MVVVVVVVVKDDKRKWWWWHEDPREGHTTGNTRQANPNYSCVLPQWKTNVVVGERRRSASFEGGARDPNGVDPKQGEEEE